MAKRGRKPKSQAYAFPSSPGTSEENLSIDRDIIDNSVGNEASELSRDDVGRVSDVAKKSDAKKRLAAAVKEIPQIFEPEHVAFVFNIYAGILSIGFSFLFKSEFSVIYEELEIEPETAATWAKPLARILSKYAPVEWAGMTAEIELVAALGLYTATSFGRARNAAKKHEDEVKREEARKRAPRPSSPPTVMPDVQTVAREL